VNDRAWFRRHPVRVAFDLIGATLVVARDGERMSGRITETEAYAGPYDLASHSARLKAARISLSGEPGCLYMYRSYGIHTMLNVVSHEDGDAGGVLIRALEPVDGIEFMASRRGTSEPRALTVGPGVLCQALGLRLGDLGYDLIGGQEITIAAGVRPASVMAGPRIGISRSIDHRWRFFDSISRFVSAHRRGEVVTPDMLDAVIEDGLPQGNQA
jgi:DNA-3-methyladenine glycosylase